MLEDTTQHYYQKGRYILFEVTKVDEENKSLISIKNSVKFIITGSYEESEKEKFTVGTKHLAKIENIDIENYQISCILSEPDSEEIKNQIKDEQLKEYIQFDKSNDLFKVSFTSKQNEESLQKNTNLAKL